MENQKTRGNSFTVGALLLHTIVLLWFDSFSLGGSIFLIWTFLAFAVTGKHYRDIVPKKYIQLWAVAHIAISIYILFDYFRLSLMGYSQPLQHFLTFVIFVTPPIAILFFVSAEGT